MRSIPASKARNIFEEKPVFTTSIHLLFERMPPDHLAVYIGSSER